MGRPPGPGRSARPRTPRGAPRCTWSSPRRAVELRREESRCALQDLVGPPELPVLPLQLRDALTVRRARAGPLATVDLGLADPLAQGFGPHPELGRDAGDGAEPLLAPVIRLEDHADAALLQL